MNKNFRIIMTAVTYLTCAVLSHATSENGLKEAGFVGYATKIPHKIAELMVGRSWQPECPVPLEDLRYLTLSYWGYDDHAHEGHLIVHAAIAQEIIDIFAELFDHKFPIERMEIIDYYDADDERSMEVNNSSAFCFRANTTTPGVYSKHSYGIAIDINPLINPYIKGTRVLPKNAHPYVDRTNTYKGMITEAPDNICYQAFIKRGYEWGGHWPDRKDYQHFCKLGLSCAS